MVASTRPRKSGGAAKERFRSKGGFIPAVTCLELRGDGSVNGSAPALQTGSFSQISDYVIPNYRERSKAGEVFINGLHIRRQEFTDGGGQGQVITNAADPSVFYDLTGPGHLAWLRVVYGTLAPIALLDEFDVAIMDELVGTAVESSRGRSDPNLWETLAEVDKTVNMLRKPLAAFDKFNKKHLARSIATSASNAWLQYRYGITPLIKDVQGIMKGLQKKVGKQRKTSRASENMFKTETQVDQYRTNFNFDIRIQKTDSLVVRGMSIDEMVIGEAFNIGFSAKNLLTLPWELVPYSFVVDWFANVGDFLGSMVPLLNVNQLGSCITRERVTTTVFTIENNFLSGGYIPGWTLTRPVYGSYICKDYRKDRGRLPSPKLSFRNDFGFDKPKRAADALALALQPLDRIFGGKKTSPPRERFFRAKIDRNGKFQD